MRGFEQVYGLDFHETWAPVGHYTTVRWLLVIRVQEGLETMHLHVRCTFQNAKLTKAWCMLSNLGLQQVHGV